jgi:energy-converting hydrogenase Eha subunit C
MASNRYLLVVRSLYHFLSTLISVDLFEAGTTDIIVLRKRYNDLTTNKYLFEAITTDIIVLR